MRKLSDDEYEATFVFRPGPGAKAVHLAGTFNNWAPSAQRMEGPDAQGRFVARLKLERGVYEYRYVVDGTTWRSDPGNPVQAGFLNNSVLEVGK